MRKVFFQVGTEFHYIFSLSIIEQFYFDSGYEIHFVFVSNYKKSRLENLKLNENYKYDFIFYNHNDNKVFEDEKEL